METSPRIGFACAYTPLALIDAAGCAPYRLLPFGDCPDQAGSLLHDNICPNVKRIIDRALSRDIPDLFGTIFINSCDAMRRMSDAWQHARKNENTILIDLPATSDDLATGFFQKEFQRLVESLENWIGRKIALSDIVKSIDKINKISGMLNEIALRFRKGKISGGRAAMQKIYNDASSRPLDETITRLEALARQPDLPEVNEGVPVFLFGNVMPDPEAFTLIESCGAVIADDDLCTGSRMFPKIKIDNPHDIINSLAKAVLSRPPCARTFDPAHPVKIAEDILKRATEANALGVIGHTVKFCDPYLERLPAVRDTLKDAGMPLLLLEGDCTLRSIGQQKTRIEAFIEMLR